MDDLCQIIMCMWSLWRTRNLFIFTKIWYLTEVATVRALEFLRMYQLVTRVTRTSIHAENAALSLTSLPHHKGGACRADGFVAQLDLCSRILACSNGNSN